jgi:SAM-dependent methyltransferase
MIDRSVVEGAYSALLGREPESEEIIRFHQQSASPAEMLVRFVNSTEFAIRYGAPRLEKSLTLPPAKIEAYAEPAVLRSMIERTGEAWTKLGETEPHWSVLTDPRFKADSIEANKAAFYGTGDTPLRYFEHAARRAGVDLPADVTCFELGCGTGRVTVFLARRFANVIACDISDNHLNVAREHLLSVGLKNVTYFHLKSVDGLREAPPFDILFTVIVLQHNAPPIIALMLRELLAKLNPGGIGYFQVPTYLHNYSFQIGPYLTADGPPNMEMHGILQRDVFDLIANAGCRVLEVREDGWTGDTAGVSNSFLIHKPMDIVT